MAEYFYVFKAKGEYFALRDEEPLFCFSDPVREKVVWKAKKALIDFELLEAEIAQ